MNTSSTTNNTNASLLEKHALLEFVKSAKLEDFSDLRYDWQTNRLNDHSPTFDLLSKHGLTERSEEGSGLTRAGRLFLSRVLLQFPDVERERSELGRNYELKKRIRVGKNSAIFLAKHKLLGTEVIAKILRPGASENIVESLQAMGGVSKACWFVLCSGASVSYAEPSKAQGD